MIVYIADSVCKLLAMTTLKRFSWTRLFSAIFQAFGVLWLVVEATDYFFSNPSWTEFLKSIWWLFCICGIFIGIARAWPKRFVSSRIKGTDIVIEVRIGDILRGKDALIVGSNTTFDTNILDDTISVNSVQGQFTRRYFYSVADLDSRLSESLRNVPVLGIRSRVDKPYGKIEEYEIGTVAPISVPERKAYFVAVAKMNT